ncbi:MAG: c-type cytochrome [Gemmatimonadota bacterium]|nr:c-type cytochrome [Gemmatimonadota bacterium]
MRSGTLLKTIATFLLVGAAGLVAQENENGRVLYDRWCAECHGAEGLGDGSAAASMLPRPRTFSQARYQVRTTGSGQLPTDDDLMHVLNVGLPGTTMPGWPNLSDQQKRDVIEYIKSFSRFFAAGPAPEPLDFGSDPGGGPEALAAGAQAYLTLECEACHGAAGRGNGTSAPTLEDWRGFPIRAADLTEAWALNGGSSVNDIHTRVLTGLDGTPMPAAIDAMNSGVVSPDEVWQLAHYVASMGPRERPRLREVVRVERASEGLPQDGSDEAWGDIEAFFFPLAGQVIEVPRNFAPTVDGIWVEGVHDGSEMAFRVQWNDPSRSPDSEWDEWQAKILATMDLDGFEAPALDSTGAVTVRWPDAIRLQFPFEVPDGAERPYFLGGTTRQPVYLWTWSSNDGVGEGRGRGYGSVEPLPGELQGTAEWQDGRWTLYLRRPIAAGADGLTFSEGVPIPVAFSAWDGSSGETDKRAGVSSWYYVLLEQEPSNAVVVTPLIAILLTGAFGLVLVRRAQGRARA